MTLQMLRCFVAVAEAPSFRQAAERLYLTQPAVSHQIQALEEELDIKLINRSERPAKLTPGGIIFYNDMKDILDQIDIAADHARDAASFQETLYIGCQSMIRLDFLPSVYREYARRCPDVYISSTELSVSAHASMFSDSLDVAFLSKDCAQKEKNVLYTTLYRGEFCCLVPENHRLASRKRISAGDLGGEVLIMLESTHCPPQMSQIGSLLHRECKDARFYLSSSSSYSLMMVEAGIGIAIMADFVCPPASKVRIVPFETEEEPEFGIATHKNAGKRKVSEFLDVTLAACGDFSRL